MNVVLAPAVPEEAELCYSFIEIGRQFQREQGFVQWTDDTPNLDTIRDDIREQKGYLIRVDGTAAGYVYISFDGESAYAEIDGEWSSDCGYAAVHRIAFSPEFRGIGLSGIVWDRIEELCRGRKVYCIRIDTDFPNRRMQHVLEKNGFRRCGIVDYPEPVGKRIAYDKVLSRPAGKAESDHIRKGENQ